MTMAKVLPLISLLILARYETHQKIKFVHMHKLWLIIAHRKRTKTESELQRGGQSNQLSRQTYNKNIIYDNFQAYVEFSNQYTECTLAPSMNIGQQVVEEASQGI